MTVTTSPSRHWRPGARTAGGERGRKHALAEGQPAARQRDIDQDRLKAVAALRIADLGSPDDRRDRVVDRLFGDAVKLQRLLIDREAQPLEGTPKLSSTSTMKSTDSKRFRSFVAVARRLAASGP